jgi:hypothetical protein
MTFFSICSVLSDVEYLSSFELPQTPFVVLHLKAKPARKAASTIPKKETKELPRGEECGICLSRKANTRLRPCGHQLCKACCKEVMKEGMSCPFCREKIYDNRPSSEKTDKRNCKVCKVKLPLTAFPCRCGELYCTTHRPPEEHECSYDYQGAQEAQLRGYRPHVQVGGPSRLEELWELLSPSAFWDWYHGFYWDHFTRSGHNRRAGALLFCFLTLCFSQAPFWITVVCLPPLWALLLLCSQPPEGSRGAEMRPLSSPRLAAFTIMADTSMVVERSKVWLRRKGVLAPLRQQEGRNDEADEWARRMAARCST